MEFISSAHSYLQAMNATTMHSALAPAWCVHTTVAGHNWNPTKYVVLEMVTFVNQDFATG
jgi:hypothetical protein